MKQLITAYIRILKNVTSGKNWVDETFEKKLSAVTEQDAFIRPIADLHSVAEIVSHLHEWRLSVLSILKGGTRTVSMDSPANWRTNQELEPLGWETLRRNFYESQEELLTLLESNEDSYLQQKSKRSGDPYEFYVSGMVEHDLYHLGQIGIVIKFLPGRNGSVN